MSAVASPFAGPRELVAPAGIAVSDICRLGATELGAAMRAGTLSAHEITAAFLNQIDRLNPVYNAVVSLRERSAILAEADAADAHRASGAACGPLHGLPIAIKDLAETKGLRTTYGSPVYADNVPAADDPGVARIRAAGAIIIGKTATPEFGFGSHTYNPVFGITRNAFDPSLSAGGSSGGAAVALALRMLPVADGSDMGGSLRNPAGYNNVYGLRPSQGRVPNPAAADLYFTQLATDGPMARTAADLALLLAVQAAHDPAAPLSLGAGDGVADASAIRRVGWLGDLAGHLPVEAGVLDVCSHALARLERAGCRVEEVRPDFDMEKLWRAFVVLRQFSTAGKYRPLFEALEHHDRLKPEMLWEIEGGLSLSALAVYEAACVRSDWFRECLRLFGEVDALALPSAQLFAFPAEWHWPREIAGRNMDSYHRWMEVVVPGTMSGCPVVSLPAGFAPGMRAMGLQVIGRPRQDGALIDLARRYESMEAH
jgi:amidase